MSTPGAAVSTRPRLASLDAFRGATVAAMILVNTPGDWGNIYWPLAHAPWHGATPTDWIFPFFLFIVGVSICFSSRTTFGAAAKRSLILVALGLVMAGFPYFDLATLRWPGVLQRIGVCYLAAWLVMRFLGTTGAAVVIAVILAGYAWLLLAVPVPGYGPANLEPETNLAACVDRRFLSGHMWRQTKTWDPEGLLSTLPAIATTLLGVLAAAVLRSAMTPRRRVAALIAAGLAGIALGAAWHPGFPINKNLWTSSYVLFTGGLAACSLGLLYWLADLTGWRAGLGPAIVFGRNAIFVFVASGLVARTLALVHPGGDDGPSLQAVIYQAAFQPFFAAPPSASLAYAVVNLILWYLLLRWLDRRGLIFRV